MSKESMRELKEILCKELDEIAYKGEMSAGDLETVHKLTDTIKNIYKIDMLSESDYSRESHNNGRYSSDSSYDSDSYGRHYVRGHYSRSRYSMAEGKQMIADEIREMMDDDGISSADRASLKKAYELLKR